MNDPHDPHEVLAAVRRLEAELDDLRAKARRTNAPDLAGLRQAIANDAARERQAVVEDLDTMLDLIGESWRDTRGRIGRLESQIGALAGQVESMVAAMQSATFEVRFGAAATKGHATSNGNGYVAVDNSAGVDLYGP